MTREEIIRDLKDKQLYTPKEVIDLINEADKYPSRETVVNILALHHEWASSGCEKSCIDFIMERL